MCKYILMLGCMAFATWAQTNAELNERLNRYENMREQADEADNAAEVERVGRLIEQVSEGLDMLARLQQVKERIDDAQGEMAHGNEISRRQLMLEIDALQNEQQHLSDRKVKYWEWVLAGEEGHEHYDAIDKEYQRYRKLSELEVENRTVRSQVNSMGVQVAHSRRAADVRTNQSVHMVQDNRALLKLLAMWKKLTQLLEAEEPDDEAIIALKSKIARAEVSRKVRSEMTRIRNNHRMMRGQAKAFSDAKISNKETAALAKQISEVSMQENEQKELVELWDAVLKAKPEELEDAEKAFEKHDKLVLKRRSVREIRSDIAKALAEGDTGAVESLKESLKEYEPPEDQDPRRLPATPIETTPAPGE